MILVKVNGGFGNQLFQYCAARALEEGGRGPVIISLGNRNRNSEASGIMNRPFELDKIKSRYRGKSSILWDCCFAFLHFIGKYTRRRGWIFIEADSAYDEFINKLNKNAFIEGYFQSYKYFSPQWERIKQDLVPAEAQSQAFISMEQKISSCDSVSIHIRRGDYVTSRIGAAVHGACPVEYYESAVNYISDKIADPFFFIFSDDVKWCMENIRTPRDRTCVVDINKGEDSYLDVFLMAKCKHNIIANSTFSWWGAWINESPSKIVIAPARWFADSAMRAPDLIPPEWIRL